tara:strand:- start:193 stop:1014 length:822 start_codon:yes stop_codon:yes gene_type:complete
MEKIMNEESVYILGTDKEELIRLELQHKVWSSEAKRGWDLAEFKTGQTILDLGCGPGYCTEELAHIVGKTGKVIGVDRSDAFIAYLNQIKQSAQLSIEPCLSDFDTLSLDPESLDGMYCRWALAWIPNPKEVLTKIKEALKPRGRMVIQEYYNWATHQTKPEKTALRKAIGAILKSFKDSDSEIDVGSCLPQYFEELGMKVIHLRLMPKLATPDSLIWEWPKTFYHSYFPRLVSMGYLDNQDVEDAMKDILELEMLSYATSCCPLMVEVIAEK